MPTNANHCIKCSVTSCANHTTGKEYCALNEISVGCKSRAVAQCSETECASFALGNQGACCTD